MRQTAQRPNSRFEPRSPAYLSMKTLAWPVGFRQQLSSCLDRIGLGHLSPARPFKTNTCAESDELAAQKSSDKMRSKEFASTGGKSMICSPTQPEPNLETLWHRGNLYAISTNRRLALLIEKARRQDEFWETVDRWVKAPLRLLLHDRRNP